MKLVPTAQYSTTTYFLLSHQRRFGHAGTDHFGKVDGAKSQSTEINLYFAN